MLKLKVKLKLASHSGEGEEEKNGGETLKESFLSWWLHYSCGKTYTHSRAVIESSLRGFVWTIEKHSI